MELRRLFDIPLYQLLHFPQKEALSMYHGISSEPYSSEESLNEIMRVSAGAINKGLERGDKVAIISKYSSPKWTFLDIGLQQIGVIPVPISPRYDDETLSFILQDAEVKIILVDGRGLYNRLVNITEHLHQIRSIFTFEQLPDLPGWNEFTDTPTPNHEEKYLASRAGTHEDDIATIVYTSNTLGRPKGVVLTHKNLVSNVKDLLSEMPLKAAHTVASFLPQHHMFERTAIYTYLAAGCKIHYIRPSETLLEDIKSVRPHYFTAIPSTLKTIYSTFLQDVLTKSTTAQSRFFKAISLGRKFKDYGKMSLAYHLKLKGADLQVFQQWKRKLGGRIEGIILGSESIPPAQARLFTAAGIDIREGYGMTETSPVISINRFEYSQVNFGTVGKPLPSVEIKISAQQDEFGNGEIYVKGDNVMKGYWKNEVLTKKVLQDGWFTTGDIGRLTLKKGFLQIAGRKADTFALADGSTIHPNYIETQITDSLYFSQAFVYGKDKPFLIALIVPFYAHLQLYANLNNISYNSNEELLFHKGIQDLFREEIQQLNQHLSPKQQIGKYQIIPQKWSFQTGELTHTLKKRRAVLSEKYQNVIGELYGL